MLRFVAFGVSNFKLVNKLNIGAWSSPGISMADLFSITSLCGTGIFLLTDLIFLLHGRLRKVDYLDD